MRAAWIVIAVAVVLASGCTRHDWIESTLVTVDLIGTWVGTISREGAYGPMNIMLTLQQGGTKVTGQLALSTSALPGSRTIDGTINGDVFRFQTQDGRVTGELQMAGDEMNGTGLTPSGHGQYQLRRQQ